jgi:glutathione S-transferase
MGSAHPDADIHPEATGPAAKIVAAHQKDEPITLYSGWFCPFVQRSWITLEEKKIPYKYVEINPYNKEPRSVLCLSDGGRVEIDAG